MHTAVVTFKEFLTAYQSDSAALAAGGVEERPRDPGFPELGQAALEGIRVQADGRLELELLMHQVPAGETLNRAEQTLSEIIGAERVRLFLRYSNTSDAPAADGLRLLPWLIEEWSGGEGFVATVLKQANFTAHSEVPDVICVGLPALLADSLNEQILADMSGFMARRGGLKLRFEVTETGVQDLTAQARHLEAERMKSLGKRQLLRRMTPSPAARPAPDKQIAEQRKPAQPHYKRKDEVLYGRINRNLSVSELASLNMDSGLVHVVGQVVNLESKTISNGQKVLLRFDLFGIDGAIACRLFVKPEQAEELEAVLRQKPWCGLDGEVSYNPYDRDITCMVRGIEPVQAPPERRDTAPEKRIELHCHTKMSSQDAICSAKDLISLAAKFGHPAIAITDHGVVQAFPEAREACDKLNRSGQPIQLIYGMEGYLVDDGSPAVFGAAPLGAWTDFVALDLETTGLDADQERIIEVGAVRYRREDDRTFVEAERFHSFVDPEKDLSEEVFKLTGIHAMDLLQAPPVFEVMEKLRAFLGDSPIVGHNVLFDLGFLRRAGYLTPEKNDPRIHFNPVAVDTVVLSRHCYPNQPSYRLGDLAAQLGLPIDSLHRAIDDARLAAELFLRLWNRLDCPELTDINDLLGCMGRAQIVERKTPVYHIILLVKSELGLYNLYRLVSASHTEYFNHRPRIPKSLLTYLRDGLILGSACEAGQVFCTIKDLYTRCGGDFELARSQLREYDIRLPAYYYDYLEIQPLTNNKYLLAIPENHIDEPEDLINLNRLVAELGERIKRPVVATCDAHFLHAEDKIFRGIMQTNMGYADADDQSELFFRTTDEMLKEFAYLGEEKATEIVIHNPQRIAARIQADLRPFPEGSFPPVISTAADDVRNMTWKTARALYEFNGKLPDLVEQRVQRELSSIIDNGFAVMYFIASKLVKKSLADGYIVGSRGSVGSSLVATFCGITEVNPLVPHYRCPHCRYSEFLTDGRYGSGYDLPAADCPHCKTPLVRDGQDIPFETFLGFDGDKQPDIDLNFSGEYQPRAHQYVVDMFGEQYTFRAGTIGSYAEKNAEGLVRGWLEKGNRTANKARIRQLAAGLNGVKRTTGQHPGGIVVIPKEREIYDFTPVQYPANDLNANMTTTHFDFKSMHDTILKLDILGHMDPTMLKMLGDLTGQAIQDIPIPDENVMALFRSTRPLGIEPGTTSTDSGTLGLPELGTPLARDMIAETTPTSFYNLVQLMGLSHGTDVWKGNAQELIRNGTCTIDEVIGCRDGIMTSLIHWGLPSKDSFDIMEKVRKGKKLSPEQLDLMRKNQVPEWYIESCKKIKYMFPKAHAAAYSISSLRIAWFKVYRPEAFYAAYFTVRSAGSFDCTIMCGNAREIGLQIKRLNEILKGFEATEKDKKTLELLELVEEMLARNISFLPLDINQSDGSRFGVEGTGLIRPSLDSIPGISPAMGDKIVAERACNGLFKNQEEAAARCGLGPSAVAALRACGAFGDLPESAQLDLFSLL